MAEKLSVQIALEGGKEIERQLADIGKAGQKAFGDIAQSAEQVGGFKNLKPEQVTERLKTLGITGEDSINKIAAAVRTTARLERLVGGIQSAEIAFARLGAAAGPVGLAIAAAMVVAAKQTISFAQSITKVSAEAIKLGLTIQQFDQLRLGLEGIGASADAIGDGIGKLSSELDKLNIKKIVDDLKAGGGVAFKGFTIGGVPMGDLQKLQDEALKVGKAGDLARKSLEKLGLPVNMDPIAAAFEKLGIQAGTAAERMPEIIEKLRQLPDSVLRTTLAITLLGEKLGTELIQALQTGGVAIDQFKQKAGTAITPEQAAAADALTQALNRLAAAWARFGSLSAAPKVTETINLLTSGLQGLQSLLNRMNWTSFGTAAGLALNPIPTLIQLIGAAILELSSQLAGLASSLASITWDAISSAGVAAWNAITQAITDTINKLMEFLGLKQSAAGATSGNGSGGEGFARGGRIGGRGSGTSDSNLAWVSRGEHIMPARAVRQPGVLAFLEALRRSGGNLSRVLDGMGRFALGGMVPRAMPAFAAGGLAGGNNVTIQFPGLPAIGGLRASSEVVDELRKAAALAQVRSGGRKPSRYS